MLVFWKSYILEKLHLGLVLYTSSHRRGVVVDFNFPNIDLNYHSAKSLDKVEFVKCVQERFLKQFVEDPARERAKLDLFLRNWSGQVTLVSVGKHFGISNHSSINFKLVMDKDRAAPQVTILS